MPASGSPPSVLIAGVPGHLWLDMATRIARSDSCDRAGQTACGHMPLGAAPIMPPRRLKLRLLRLGEAELTHHGSLPGRVVRAEFGYGSRG